MDLQVLMLLQCACVAQYIIFFTPALLANTGVFNGKK